MASFLLLPFFQRFPLAIPSIKRTSSTLLRLAIPIALPLTSFALLPRFLPPLLSLLTPISSLLTPCSVFLYANLLIVAIVLSSASSPNSSSLSHDRSFFSSSPHCNSYNASDFYLPSESALQSVPRQKTRHLQLQRPLPGSALVVSDPLSSPPAGVLHPSRSTLTCPPICSHLIAVKRPATLAQTLALGSDQGRNGSAFSPRSFKEPEGKTQLAMKKLDQKHFGVVGWTGGRIIRSKSEQRICDPATPPTRTLRRVETMDEASMVLRSPCDEKLSLSAAMDMPSIESLSDDALNKRCEEFIAKSLAKMRKELLECRD